MAPADRTIDALASRQHGIVDREQARACGLTGGQVTRRLASGRFMAVHPGVYLVGGAPLTAEGRLLAACRAARHGATGSHRSAGWLWSLHDLVADSVEIAITADRNPRLRGVAIHRSADLSSRHCTVRRGIPVTNPLRTIVDLGAVLTPTELEDALDRGLAARLFSVAAVEWMRDELARPGRNGCGVLKHVLDERALGAARPDGLLEPRMARLLRAAGLPAPAFQHWVAEARARVDFAYPERRLAIEVDGYAVHGSPRAMAADFERQNRLAAAGWTVLRFTWAQVVRSPADVAAAVAGAL